MKNLVKSRILEVQEKGYCIFETAHKSKIGKIIPIEISSRLINFNKKPAILSIGRDITDRKEVD